MEELITKKFEVKDKLNDELDKTVNSDDVPILSRPISLRLLSSFLVILPIFVQAPWVRLEPVSALCFTFVILSGAFFLYKKRSNKWFIVSSLLLGVSGSYTEWVLQKSWKNCLYLCISYMDI